MALDSHTQDRPRFAIPGFWSRSRVKPTAPAGKRETTAPEPAKVNISLIGPRRGGKSALLATMRDSVQLGSHGYPTDWLVSISHDFAELKFKDLRGQFYDPQYFATDQNDIFEYEFTLNIGPRGKSQKFKFGVVDSAGELAVPRGESTFSVELNTATRNKVFERLYAADAAIFVAPLFSLRKEGWVSEMAELVEKLVGVDKIGTKRLIVAFSHYERLFLRLGPNAWQAASDPDVALYVIRDTLKTIDNLKTQLEMLAENCGVDVRFTVTSSYGFTRDFGNPNIDPFASSERRFQLANEDSLKRAVDEYWRPFLTADPFVFAACGIPGGFMFTLDEVGGHIRAPEPSEPVAPERSGLESLMNSAGRFILDLRDVNRRGR